MKVENQNLVAQLKDFVLMDKVLSNVVLVETLHNLQIHLAELKKNFFSPVSSS